MANSAYMRDYMREVYRPRKSSLGFCSKCGARPKVKGHQQCQYCLDNNNKNRPPKDKAIRDLKSWKPIKEVGWKYKLYHLMQENNISIKTLAKAIGVTDEAVQRWLFYPELTPTKANQKALNFYFKEDFF